MLAHGYIKRDKRLSLPQLGLSKLYFFFTTMRGNTLNRTDRSINFLYKRHNTFWTRFISSFRLKTNLKSSFFYENHNFNSIKQSLLHIQMYLVSFMYQNRILKSRCLYISIIHTRNAMHLLFSLTYKPKKMDSIMK